MAHAEPDPETSEPDMVELEPAMVLRLKNRSDFLLARNGARSHERAFVLQGRARQDGTRDIRIGYTVTKKVGNAVERNRIRRRLREAVRSTSAAQPILSKLAGYDVVIIARRVALTQPFSQLVNDLGKGLQQLVAKRSSKGQKRRQQTKPDNGSGKHSSKVSS